MKIKSLISVVLLVLMCFISGCKKKTSLIQEKFKIYNSESSKYFVADATTSTPALENFKFSFPIISNNAIQEVKDIHLYYDNEEIVLDSIDDIIVSEIKNNINDKEYRYQYCINTIFNKKNINGTLNIDKIEMRINDTLFSFFVDIKIVYKHIQDDYKIDLYPYYYEIDSSTIEVVYSLVCYPIYSGSKKITKISGNILDSCTSYNAKIVDMEKNTYDYNNFSFKQNDNFYLKIRFEGIKTFVSDSIYLTIDYDGSEIIFCSNLNMITCLNSEIVSSLQLFNAIL